MIRLTVLTTLAIVTPISTPQASPREATPGRAERLSYGITAAQTDRFFGDRRVAGLGRGPVAQAWFTATVPMQESRRLRAGYRFVAGCRAHDCPTKAAAIIAPGGAIVGAAMVALKCGETCEDTSTGFVFVRRTTPAWARDELMAWSHKALAANASMEPTMGSIDEVRLDEPGAATPPPIRST